MTEETFGRLFFEWVRLVTGWGGAYFVVREAMHDPRCEVERGCVSLREHITVSVKFPDDTVSTGSLMKKPGLGNRTTWGVVVRVHGLPMFIQVSQLRLDYQELLDRGIVEKQNHNN